MDTDYKYADITEQIICEAFVVHNALGHGFVEKVYEKPYVNGCVSANSMFVNSSR